MTNSSSKYAILIHYSEIALKKNNRPFFERKFIENIRKHLKNLSYSKVRKISARVFVEGIKPSDWKIFKTRIKNVMGLKNAIFMIQSDTDISKMKLAVDILIKDCEYDSFRISSKINRFLSIIKHIFTYQHIYILRSFIKPFEMSLT